MRFEANDAVGRCRTVTPIRFGDVVVSEVTKILTHRASVLAVVLTLILNLALGAVGTMDLFHLYIRERFVSVSDVGQVMLAPIYIFLILPVFAAGSEHTSGQVRVTLVATPRRSRLAFAKLTALVAITIPAAFISLAPGRLFLSLANGQGFADAAVDLGLWVLTYSLMSLVANGLTGITRSSVVSLSLLILIPIMIAAGILQWPLIVRYLPDQLGLSLLGGLSSSPTGPSPWTAGLLLFGWAVVLGFIHHLATVRRDS